MRILRTTKPIPAWYLKTGQDHGSYDVERLIWLPGNCRPIRVPDIRGAGLKRMGVAKEAYARPPVKTKPAPHHQGAGLYVPPGYVAREQAKKASSLSSAAFAAKER